jgi:hypothetical protein
MQAAGTLNLDINSELLIIKIVSPTGMQLLTNLYLGIYIKVNNYAVKC